MEINLQSWWAVGVRSLTFEAWVKTLALPGGGNIAGQIGGGANGSHPNMWQLSLQEGRPKLEIWWPSSSMQLFSYKRLQDTDWHLITWSYDYYTKQANLYLDNELVGTMVTPEPWNLGNGTVEVGSVSTIGWCGCAVDELRISGIVRVPEQPVAYLPGDANGDFKVDGIDYVAWLLHYNQWTDNGQHDGDYNFDGTVDGVDYVRWLTNYGADSAPTTSAASTTFMAIAAASAPSAPANVALSYETGNYSSTLVLTWDDTAGDEDGFRFTWEDGTISTLPNPPSGVNRDTTESVILETLPVYCENPIATREVQGSFQSFNSSGASNPVTVIGQIPVCPTSKSVVKSDPEPKRHVYLPLTQKRA